MTKIILLYYNDLSKALYDILGGVKVKAAKRYRIYYIDMQQFRGICEKEGLKQVPSIVMDNETVKNSEREKPVMGKYINNTIYVFLKTIKLHTPERKFHKAIIKTLIHEFRHALQHQTDQVALVRQKPLIKIEIKAAMFFYSILLLLFGLIAIFLLLMKIDYLILPFSIIALVSIIALAEIILTTFIVKSQNKQYKEDFSYHDSLLERDARKFARIKIKKLEWKNVVKIVPIND